ncbi:MAG: prepilin-type N-terminal cleavage/methylation domain-containing protein [Candidatus Syntrophonatronum acetioxidans]|uniref:Prepilin-type N-terminal cleavage/methylation domain-containing protein n=1 Tax=Candidatus Syntrophonatronum acetioxidans TaxID=1795816 RepID=A0A424YAC9_9FIRM|nr:MAG: prepilin-type N-terminal cleavage/methylation domain-containing protein [Candidatus Syntrophonatronum acetioxidans]
MERLILRMSKKQEGLTLVELVIVLSLLSIILALGYMYYDFGVQAFERGEHRTIAQKAVRLTADFITSEIRYAKEIEINPEEAPPEGNGDNGYRFIYEEDNSIIYQDEKGSKWTLADRQADDMPYSIYFTSNVPEDVVIFYIIADYATEPDSEGFDMEEEKEKGLYSLETRVQALNIRLYRTYSPEGELIKLNDDGGSVIKYKKPE